MARKRKVRRSLATALLVWAGRRMLSRVQQQTLRSVTRKPKPTSKRAAWLRSGVQSGAAASRLLRGRASAPAVVTLTSSSSPRRRGKGIALALLSAAAVAALKVGVDHVIEAEREVQVVTPDFDVFSDDDE